MSKQKKQFNMELLLKVLSDRTRLHPINLMGLIEAAKPIQFQKR